MVKIRIGSTIFDSGVMALPNSLFNSRSTYDEFKALFDFDGKRYMVKVSSNSDPVYVPGEPLYYKTYRINLTKPLREKFISTFAYSYLMNIDGKLGRKDCYESIMLEGKVENGVPVFVVTDKEIYTENELLPIIHKYIISRQFDAPKLKPKSKSTKNIFQHFSKIYPIADYKKHSHVTKAVYWWLDMNNKKLYIGKANNLVSRFGAHARNVKNAKTCTDKYGSNFDITHFGYLKFVDIVPEKLILAFELFAIKLVAALIPNRSALNPKGPTIPHLITDTSWELVNNKYN